MKPIPSFRAAHMIPYLEYLRSVGSPVESELIRAKLPTMLEEKPNAYLPLLPALDFVKHISYRDGIDEIAFRSHQQLEIESLSKEFQTLAHQQPTLKAALESFQSLVMLEDPYLKLWFEVDEEQVKVCIFEGSSNDILDTHINDWVLILILISIVREFAGSDFQPDTIAFRSTVVNGRCCQQEFPNTLFVLGKSVASITLPRYLLSLPPLKQQKLSATEKATPVQLSEIEPIDFTTSLKQILPAYISDGYPGIEHAAEISLTSVRTLQRRLRESGLSYSDLIQQIRLEESSKLLRETDLNILDISSQLSYKNQAHFSRAFKRQTGLTPFRYRAQFSQQDGYIHSVV